MGRILRILVSIALLCFLLLQLDFGTLRESIREARLEWVLIPHFLSVATMMLCAVRWQLLLRAHSVRIGTRASTRYLLIGHFFSNFLPSNVGGDVVRASLATRAAGKEHWPTIAASVVVDRLTGLLAIFLVLPAGIALHYEWVRSTNIIGPLAIACAAFLVLAVAVFTDFGVGLLARVARVPWLGKPVRLVQKLHDAMLEYRKDRTGVVGAVGLSITFYLVAAFQMALLLRAFPAVDVAWTTQIVALCAISLLAMIPVSFNGYGVQEGGYVLLLVSLGFTQNQAILLALGNRLFSVLVSVVGGVAFATGKVSRNEVEEAAVPATTDSVVEVRA